MNEKETTTAQHLDVHLLQDLLDTSVFGIDDHLVYLPSVDSTNTLALHMAQNGSREGVVVLTDNQKAGRGRLGRQWLDRSGCNALTSTILYPLFPPYFLVMMASIAVVEAIAETCDVTATIKWPNDVLIEDKKVSGILIETSRTQSGLMAAIVGIGVNINGDITHIPGQATAPLQFSATTLETACGHAVSREQFIARLLHHLEQMYLGLQQEMCNQPTPSSARKLSHSIQARWRNELSTLGRHITVRQGENLLNGIAVDVNATGELQLRTPSGEIVNITWGDIGYPTE